MTEVVLAAWCLLLMGVLIRRRNRRPAETTEEDVAEIKVQPMQVVRDGVPLKEGDVIALKDGAGGRSVRVLEALPQVDGSVLVSEEYCMAAQTMGAEFQPAKVIVELSPGEAYDLLNFWELSVPSHATPRIRDFFQALKATSLWTTKL